MKKKEIKIVGLDLDGTLLTDKKELLPYTKNVIGQSVSEWIDPRMKELKMTGKASQI